MTKKQELKMEKSEIEKKYSGYGYHGGGRKPLPDGEKKVFQSTTISGTPEEIASLKKLADNNGKSVSRFVLDNFIKR